MIKFNHNNNSTMKEIFDVNEKDISYINTTILPVLASFDKCSKAVERVWIDENISEGAKLWLVFTIGRNYQLTMNTGGLYD